MAFQVFENSDQGAIFVVALVLIPVCVLVGVLRLAVIRQFNRKIAIEDWMVFLALLIFLAWAIYGLVLVVDIEQGTKGIFDITQFDPTVWKNTIETGYFLQIFFGIQQTCVKLSLLIFYHRIFSVDKRFDRLTYIVGAVQVLYCIAWILLSILSCLPPRKLWEPLTPGTCLDFSIVLAATESVNSVIDFVMVGMAIFIVRKLKISKADKWKLSLLFAFGGLTGLFGFVRIGMAYGTVGDSDHVLIYMLLQMGSGIICCSLPLYRAAFLELPILRNIGSWVSSVRGGTRQSRNGRDTADQDLPTIKTIGQRTTNGRNRSTEEWMHLDESCSSRHLTTVVWADAESGETEQVASTHPAQAV